MKRMILAALLVATVGACARVNETEHCVRTAYGNVVDEKVTAGLTMMLAPGLEMECFSLTDQNYPEKLNDESPNAMQMQVQTGGGEQPLTVTIDVSAVYSFDPKTVFQLYLDKRSEHAAEVEIFNSVEEGTRAAFSSWTVSQLFGPERAALSDSVRAHIQRKLGNRAQIKNVFVKNMQLPPAIEQARIKSAAQALALTTAKQQFEIDSTNSAANLMAATSESKANALRAQSYTSNPKLLDLEIARAWSEGFAKVCNGATTCIVGGSAMELLPFRNK